MPALSLSAVCSFNGKSGVALSADFLVAIKLFGDGSDGWVHNASPEPEDEVQRGLLLDVVVGKTSAV